MFDNCVTSEEIISAYRLLARHSGQIQEADGARTDIYWSHSAILDQGIKSLPAWIRVADCRRALHLRRWYLIQQHWMVKAHWERIFFLWSSRKSSCGTETCRSKKYTTRLKKEILRLNHAWKHLFFFQVTNHWLGEKYFSPSTMNQMLVVFMTKIVWAVRSLV